MSAPIKLPTVTIQRNGYAVEYTIDFRLAEIRVTGQPHISIPFYALTDEEKAKIRGIRFRETSHNYIKGLDD